MDIHLQKNEIYFLSYGRSWSTQYTDCMCERFKNKNSHKKIFSDLNVVVVVHKLPVNFNASWTESALALGVDGLAEG